MYHFLNLLFLLICSGNYELTFAGKVLFIPPMISPSHKIPLKIWANLLHERGHEIFWWAPAAKLDHYQPEPADRMHVEHFLVDVDDQRLMDGFRHLNATFIHNFFWDSQFLPPFFESMFALEMMPFCESVIANHRESFRRVVSRQYDLVVVDDLFTPCGWTVAQMTRGPTAVFVTTSSQTRLSTKFNNIPVQYATTPVMGDLFLPSDQMGFVERTRTASAWAVGYIADYFIYQSLSDKVRKHLPQVERIEKAMIRPHMQFLSMSKMMDFVGPTVHNLINVGGLHVPHRQDVKPLDDKFKSMISQGTSGFVVLSFGHWLNWTNAAAHIREAFIESLKKVPSKYSVIWQYDGPPIVGKPENVHTVRWLPLTNLLADSKCKLFISHCGCNSLIEASVYGVPILAIPHTADQPGGAARAVRKNFGLLLKKTEITTETLLNAITEVLNNDSYFLNAKRFASLPHLMDPKQTTVFWSEFVMRNHMKKDGLFYRTSQPATKMNWIQIYSLDILFALSALSVFIVFSLLAVFVLIRSIFYK